VIEEIHGLKQLIGERVPQKKKRQGLGVQAEEGDRAPKKAKGKKALKHEGSTLKSLQKTLLKLQQKKAKGDALPGMIASLRASTEGHRESAKNAIEDGNGKLVRKEMAGVRKASVQKALREKVLLAYQKNEAALLVKIAEQGALIDASKNEDDSEDGSEDEECANPDCAKE